MSKRHKDNDEVKAPGLYLKNGWYYYQPPQVCGVRVKAIALKTQDGAKAVKTRKEIIAEGTEIIDPTKFPSAVKMYFLDRATELAPSTLSGYKRKMKRAETFFGNCQLAGIDEMKVKKYRKELIATEVDENGTQMSDSSVRSYTETLRSFFTWAYKEAKLIRVHPMKDIASTKVENTKKKMTCTFAQKEALLDGDPGHYWVEAILMIGFNTGMRIKEILAFHPGWIEEGEEGEMVIRPQREYWFNTKNGKSRDIPVNSELRTWLKSINREDGEPFIYPQRPVNKMNRDVNRYDPKKAFQAYAVSLGIKGFSYHAMRRTFANHHLRLGTPLVEVADWIGDKPDMVLKHYKGWLGAKHANNIVRDKPAEINNIVRDKKKEAKALKQASLHLLLLSLALGQ